MSTAVVWFRDDLRVADNPALTAAVACGYPVVALYVLDEESAGIRPLGAASRWWLHGSLESLGRDLAELGIPLVLRRGPASACVADVVQEISASAVFWNRRYGGPERTVDTALKTTLQDAGLRVESFAAALLFEPWKITTGSGTPYSVFTPFWNACLRMPPPREPLPVPAVAGQAPPAVDSDALADWELQPRSPDWAAGLRQAWMPGERSAHLRLEEFLTEDLERYPEERDFPGIPATSRLSPYLRWGEVSPAQVWHVALELSPDSPARAAFLRQLAWREFAWHTLYFHPDMATVNLRDKFDGFPWGPSSGPHLEAWKRGRTGIPLVDAGMRELWETGTMHNRVRMVAASFLIKNLLTDWRIGEAWFWETLVDADAASNPFSWQWVAGSGLDASPYFRIFNPERQAHRFDPDGAYVRRWVPAGTEGSPIVDLAVTRAEALEAFQQL